MPKIEKLEQGFYGLDASADIITESGFAILLSDPAMVVSYHAEGKENSISLPAGTLKKDDLFRLSKLTRNIKIDGLSGVIDEHDAELPRGSRQAAH